jgi:rubrerythrin
VRELLEHYDDVARVYQETMEKQLFSYSVRDVETMYASDIEAQIKYFQATAGRNYVAEWVTSRGWQDITKQSSMETVIAVIEKCEPDRKKLSRVKKSMRKSRFDSEALRSAGTSTRTTGQLYEEMREKVLNQHAA